MRLEPTASQTVGPFFHFCLTQQPKGCLTGAGERIRVEFRVCDGDGAAVDDAMIEIWQADADGNYDSSAFHGFGRLATDGDGRCVFETVKPGRVELQAPHINVCIFARGLLKHLVSRVYFAGDAANVDDPVLPLVAENRRETLMACLDQGVWKFDIRLSGEGETVFFDV